MVDEINRLYNFSSPATFDERFALPVDVDSPSSRMQALANSANTLAGGVALPVEGSTSTGSTTLDNLMGLGGRERVQLWPEKMVRGGLNAPQDAMAGRTSEELIPGAMDMAGLAGSGGLMVGRTAATLGSAPFLRPALKYEGKIYKAPEGGQHLDALPKDLQATFEKQAMSGEDISNFNFGFMNHKGQFLSREKALDYAIKEGLVDPSVGQYGALTSTLFNENRVGTGVAALDKAPRFFSQVENVVKNAKMEKGSSEQWLGYIKNQPGVRGEELEWVMKDLPKGQLTKEQVAQHVAENKVEVGEVVKGKNGRDENGYLGTGGDTKYSQYQLPGGENYREVLMTLPEKVTKDQLTNAKKYLQDKGITEYTHADLQRIAAREAEDYKSSHWDEPNVLAHIRMNDRTIDGKKSLHLEEIQSDWHQAGREKGYKLSEKDHNQWRKLGDKLENTGELTKDEIMKFNELQSKNIGDIPNAPFKKTWTELALKRAISEAAEKGYDRLSWTPGEAQVARYDLSKQIDKLYYNPEKQKLTAYDKNDNLVLNKENITKEKLNNEVGKEISEKILNNPTRKEKNYKSDKSEDHVLEGQDLKIGGEGMKGYYDQIVPKTVEKLTGEKVKSSQLVDRYEIKKSYVHGEERYSIYEDGKFHADLKNKEEAEKYIDRKKAKSENNRKVYYIDIPQSLREKATKGFPLFSSSPVLVPVDHDPWKHKLTPINYNPFENPNAI